MCQACIFLICHDHALGLGRDAPKLGTAAAFLGGAKQGYSALGTARMWIPQ